MSYIIDNDKIKEVISAIFDSKIEALKEESGANIEKYKGNESLLSKEILELNKLKQMQITEMQKQIKLVRTLLQNKESTIHWPNLKRALCVNIEKTLRNNDGEYNIQFAIAEAVMYALKGKLTILAPSNKQLELEAQQLQLKQKELKPNVSKPNPFKRTQLFKIIELDSKTSVLQSSQETSDKVTIKYNLFKPEIIAPASRIPIIKGSSLLEKKNMEKQNENNPLRQSIPSEQSSPSVTHEKEHMQKPALKVAKESKSWIVRHTKASLAQTTSGIKKAAKHRNAEKHPSLRVPPTPSRWR